jgi:hypothetical protein
MMTGSSGSGYGGGFDGGRSACDTLVIETQISSPKVDVVKHLIKGVVLTVGLAQVGGVTAVVLVHQGQVAGGVADPSVQRLRECIAQGTQYAATVRAINGGLVTVRIAPIPST